MSIESAEKLRYFCQDLWQYMRDIPIPLEKAESVLATVKGIDRLVEVIKVESQQEETNNLIQIIEGLLANWPDTEIINYYLPPVDRPVLTKDEALKRAAVIAARAKDDNTSKEALQG